MTLQELSDIAHLFSSHKYISHIARVSDNVILLRLDSTNYNIDLSKNASCVYIRDEVLKEKIYTAPFDTALQKYLNRATLKGCFLDSMNKILVLECETKNKYKHTQTTLYLEFITNKTNAIIVSQGLIISALHFLESPQRKIVSKARFTPLSQPHFKKILNPSDDNTTLQNLKQNFLKIQENAILNKRKILKNIINQKMKRLESILISLPDSQNLKSQRDENIKVAHHILMHLDSIPGYTSEVMIDAIPYSIPQESKPSTASDKLFKIAKKLGQKIQNINIQKENVGSKIAFLRNELRLIESASLEELVILESRVGRRANMSRTQRAKKHYQSYFIDGIKVSIGRSEQENIRLLQDARAEFYWLHILDMPSSHMIIHAKSLDSRILHHAGQLLAKLNGASGKVIIDYTKRKFVKLTQGANVVYGKESRIVVG